MLGWLRRARPGTVVALLLSVGTVVLAGGSGSLHDFPAGPIDSRLLVPQAWADGARVNVRYPVGLEAPGVNDAQRFALQINGHLVGSPVKAVDNGTGFDLEFAEGPGSADVARLSFGPLGASYDFTDLPIEVRTPLWVLPATLLLATSVADPVASEAYVFGGVHWISPTSPDSIFPEIDAQNSRGTAAIIRVDLHSGAVRTSRAVLPQAMTMAEAVWDNHSTITCPAGCAYLFGGLSSTFSASGRFQERSILRFDPVSDTITVLNLQLPAARYEWLPVMTGNEVLLYTQLFTEPGSLPGPLQDTETGGGGRIYRFDPAKLTLVQAPAIMPAPVASIAGGWDPTPRPGCSSGCAYYFGRWTPHGPDPFPDSTTPISRVIRFDNATGTTTPQIAQVIESPSPLVLQMGDRFLLPVVDCFECPYPDTTRSAWYDITTDTWTLQAALVPGAFTSALATNGHTLYAFGGAAPPDKLVREVRQAPLPETPA